MQSLNDRQRKFTLAYTDLDGIGYHNATKSAAIAGYSKKSAKGIGTQQIAKPKILQAIAKIEAEDAAIKQARIAIDLEYLQRAFQDVVDRAKLENDRPNELRALEDLARTAGAFKEGYTISVEARREYTELEKQEARRLADLLHNGRVSNDDTQGHGTMVEGTIVHPRATSSLADPNNSLTGQQGEDIIDVWNIPEGPPVTPNAPGLDDSIVPTEVSMVLEPGSGNSDMPSDDSKGLAAKESEICEVASAWRQDDAEAERNGLDGGVASDVIEGGDTGPEFTGDPIGSGPLLSSPSICASPALQEVILVDGTKKDSDEHIPVCTCGDGGCVCGDDCLGAEAGEIASALSEDSIPWETVKQELGL